MRWDIECLDTGRRRPSETTVRGGPLAATGGSTRSISATSSLHFVASQTRKKRAAVKERSMSAEEQARLRAAKEREWTAWLGNQAMEVVRRDQSTPKRVIGSRWVLTVKQDGAHKARLCALGYAGPDACEVERDPPTMSQVRKHLLLQLRASRQWQIQSLDVKTAFLAGDLHDRNLFLDVAMDLANDVATRS